MEIQSGVSLWGRDRQRMHSQPPCRHKAANVLVSSRGDRRTYAAATVTQLPTLNRTPGSDSVGGSGEAMVLC